jgi:citrate lyase beta subunit
MGHTDWSDPKQSPLVRHVLYTNECSGMLSAFVSMLLLRARPERVKAALQGVLDDFDDHAASARRLADAMAAQKGEPSGWEERPSPKDVS